MSAPADIRFSSIDKITAAQFVDVLRRSTLAERRPVDQAQVVAGMLANADILITAWADDLLVGVSRAISDFSFCTYLSDLAVDAAYQRRGIGRELIRLTRKAAGAASSLVLLAAPAAEGYYPGVGMLPHPSAWITPGQRTPRPQT